MLTGKKKKCRLYKFNLQHLYDGDKASAGPNRAFTSTLKIVEETKAHYEETSASYRTSFNTIADTRDSMTKKRLTGVSKTMNSSNWNFSSAKKVAETSFVVKWIRNSDQLDDFH